MAERPTGTVTFLFTDIEGSTKLWQQYPSAMPEALAHHHAILREAIEAHGGYVFQIIGDAFCAAFSTAADGLEAALAAQRGLRDERWGETGPIRVRMALHTGAAEVRTGEFTSGEYVSGLTLSRAARLLSAGHGGQILLSLPSAELVRDQLPSDVSLRDLDAHRLKDLIRPEHIYQVVVPDLRSDFLPLKTLDTHPNNLPIQLTSFIGREQEMARVKEILNGTRLVTLTGAGGAGKTRLALQVAADLIDEFPDGVWFVELAALTDPGLIPQTVASILGLREEAGRPVVTMLSDYLRAKTTLLVLDNCEHLIDACAKFADTILHAAPKVKILATGREALGIAGETAYRVPSLSLPPSRLPISNYQSLNQYEAVRLFIDRALAVQPDFSVTNTNAPAVAQICQRLDGIPLALELAAARVKSLSVEQIAARLDDRFRLLTGGSRTALPRHQTLRAAIDWSFSLLTEEERVLLRRLSVFAGGWTLEAAQAVCSCDPVCADDVLDLLARLVDKSLVIFEQRDCEARYRMMETIRQYADVKLSESGETNYVRRCHLDFFLNLVEDAEPMLEGAQQAIWLNCLERELDNLRAALRWSLENREADSGLRLAGGLHWFWWSHNHWSEGRRWLEQALRQTGDTSVAARAKALFSAGYLAVFQNDYEYGIPRCEESLTLFRELGDKRNAAWALYTLGSAAGDKGDLTRMNELAEESLVLRRQVGDKRGIAFSLDLLGEKAYAEGDFRTARHHSEEALGLFRELEDRWGIASALLVLAQVDLYQKDYELATIHSQEGLALWRELGDKRMSGMVHRDLGLVAHGQGDHRAGRALLVEALSMLQEVNDKWAIAQALEVLAPIEHSLGNSARAARLFGAAETLRGKIGVPLSPAERVGYEKTVGDIRARFDESTFAKTWAEGRAMTLEQVLAYALKEVGSE